MKLSKKIPSAIWYPPSRDKLRRAAHRRSQVWVTVYQVTRHYGGREEGGWWYNWYEPVKSVRAPARFADRRRAKLNKSWKYRIGTGNIYSVLGGVACVVAIEHERYENQTLQRPYYE